MAKKPKPPKPATPFERFVAAIASVPNEEADAIERAGAVSGEPSKRSIIVPFYPR